MTKTRITRNWNSFLGMWEYVPQAEIGAHGWYMGEVINYFQAIGPGQRSAREAQHIIEDWKKHKNGEVIEVPE